MKFSTAWRGEFVGEAELGGEFGLRVERQALFGATGEIMQVHAHVPQEGFRLLEGLVFVLGEDVVLDEVRRVVDTIEIFADPVERLQVPQPALAFLDVGLDQVAAFALMVMALVALGQLGLDEILARAGGDVRPEFLAQLVVEFLVARQITRFQKGGADGDVLLGQPHAFGQRARGVPDLQPQVPQHVEHKLDDAFAPGRLLGGAHEQQIDVGAGGQLAAAVSARRHDGDVFGCGGIFGWIETLDGEVVEYLDGGVLDLRQRARRRLPGQILGQYLPPHALARVQKLVLDEGQRLFAQFAAIVLAAGKRLQFAAQRLCVERHYASRSLLPQSTSLPMSTA